jgi:hypothetical protein
VSDTEVVDAEIVPEATEPEPTPEPTLELPARASAPSHELVRYNAGSTELVAGATAAERVAHARDIATALNDVIVSQGLRTKVGSRKKLDPRTGDPLIVDGREVWEPRWHVDVEGWQTLATLLGCAIIPRPPVAVVNPSTGQPIVRSFEVTEKAYHPKNKGGGLKHERTWTVEGHDWQVTVDIVKDGALIASGTGLCSRTESKWNSSDEFAVQSMAATRGASRAVANCARWIVALAGYSTTPSEEMPKGTDDAPSSAGLAFGDALPDEHKQRVGQAIYALINDPATEAEPDAAAVAALIVQDAGGYFPRIVARAILHLEKALTTKAAS